MKFAHYQTSNLFHIILIITKESVGTFCKFDFTNVSPDGVLVTHSGGRLSLRASSGVTY